MEIQFSPLCPGSSTEACKILTDIYLNVEPTSSAIDIPREDFQRYAVTTFGHSVADGLATGVKYNQELVGVLLCKDYHSHQARNYVLGPSFGPIEKLINTHRPHTPKYHHEKVLYCSGLAVKSEHAGKGFGKMLMHFVLNRARESGYTKAVAECNSIQSQRILEKTYSPRLLNYIDYTSFEYHGKRVYQSIHMHGGSKLYEIDLVCDPLT